VPETCAAEPLPAPRPALVPGCASAACTDLDGGRRVCSCLAQQGNPGFLLLEGARPLLSWIAPIAGNRGEDPTLIEGTAVDFEVLRAELDGDGHREHVVAFRRELNDVGMSWWNLAVISGSRPGQRPLLLSAANFGEGSLVQAGPGGRCDLLSTTWELGWEPGRRVDGWYLLARPMRYEGGALSPLPAQPILSRRLLYSFEPGSTGRPGGLALGTPARDLTGRGVAERWTEPLVERALLGEGLTQVVEARPSGFGPEGPLQVLVLPWGSLRRELSWRSWDDGYEALGDLGTRRLLPPGYLPAEPAWPQGRQALLSSYQGLYGDSMNVLWIGG